MVGSKAAHLLEPRKQRQRQSKRLETRYTLRRHAPSDLTPPAMTLLIVHSTRNSSIGLYIDELSTLVI
jgi:hypothetical protein